MPACAKCTFSQAARSVQPARGPADRTAAGAGERSIVPPGRGAAGHEGTLAQAAKMPMFAATPTEVLEAMHHCMLNEE